MENKLDDDKIGYNSVNVNITILKEGIYSAGLFITSNNKMSMGEYHLDRQSYIQNVVFIPATKKLGLVDIRGIVESSSKIKEDEENTKRIEQGIEKEEEHIRKNTFASPSSSPLKNIGNSPQKNNNKKKASLSLPFDEQVSILNTQREQFIFPQSGNELEGKTFVLTGTFDFLVEDAASLGGRYADLSKGKSEMTDVIICLGGRVVANLSSVTDFSSAFVLMGDGIGLTNLIQQGKSLSERVPIINVDGLHRLVTGKVTDENLRKEPVPKFGETSFASKRYGQKGYGQKRKATKHKSVESTRKSNKRKKKNAKCEWNSDDEESEDETFECEEDEIEDKMDRGGQVVDEWVECTKCGKWRKLPASIAAASLPDEWYCTNNTWDVRFATCDAIEESEN